MIKGLPKCVCANSGKFWAVKKWLQTDKSTSCPENRSESREHLNESVKTVYPKTRSHFATHDYSRIFRNSLLQIASRFKPPANRVPDDHGNDQLPGQLSRADGQSDFGASRAAIHAHARD